MAIDFPSSPTTGQVFQNWLYDGEKWLAQGVTANAVRYDMAQGLTANQQAQARANIAVTKKNYIGNGAMMISQENGNTAGTSAQYFPVDQFQMTFSNAGTQTAQQVASVTPGGSPNRLRITATAADASVGAGDLCMVRHNIEGLRTVDLRQGSASAKTITIQFGVKAPAGTYAVNLLNAAVNRSYVAEYVITAGEANTDVVKSVTIALDQAGTWAADNTVGLTINWTLMAGSTYQVAAGSWAAGLFFGSPNQFNFMATAGRVFELFDVSLTEGNVAPPFQVPDYTSELAACKRYWQKLGGAGSASLLLQTYASAASQYCGATFTLSSEMRANPAMTEVGTFVKSNMSGNALFNPDRNCISVQLLSAAAGVVSWYANTPGVYLALNARL